MKKFFAIAVAVAFLAVAAPVDATKTQETNYVAPQPIGLLAIWCAAGGHEYAPIGSHEDYEDPLGYAFSGEPECLAGDVAFGTDDDHGINGVAYAVGPEDLTSTLTVTLEDDNFDSTNVFLSASTTAGESVTDESCGSAAIVIPADLEQHWQSSESNPLFLVWAFIDGAKVDADTLEVCLGSSGVANAVYGF